MITYLSLLLQLKYKKWSLRWRLFCHEADYWVHLHTEDAAFAFVLASVVFIYSIGR